MTRCFSPVLLSLFLFACGTGERPLPEDVYEAGWDETTRSQRIALLEADLATALAVLSSANPDAATARRAVRDAARLLSSLRPELTTSERGREKYRELESKVEGLSGDSL